MKWRQSFLLLLTGLCAVTHDLPPQYHFIHSALSWSKARTYCRQQHTNLATVFDIEDMNRLVNTAQYSTGGFTERAWIGLHDNLTSWRWSFSDSGYYGDKEADYRNWGFDQPDNFLGEQMCVEMWGGGVWLDSKCSLRHPFICYDGATSTNQRFILVEQDLSWDNARLYCRKHHTDLVSIRNEEENREIQLLAKNRIVWIGLYRTREWSDGSDTTYSYWKPGQPDNVGGRQSCVASDLGNAGRWSDEECSREFAFVCHGEKDETPVLTTTTTTTTTSAATTVTPNKITTTKGDSTSTKITSNETSDKSGLFTTTVTPNKRTTTEIRSTTGHVSAGMISSEQPSTSELDQTRTITNITPNQTLLAITTSVTANTITTERDSISTKLTSTEPLSTAELHQTKIYLSTQVTSSSQPSTLETVQTTDISDETPNKPVLSTSTTVTQNQMTTIEEDSISPKITSRETPDNLILFTTTVTPNKRTTTEIRSTTGHVSAGMISSEQPSTSEVDQTRAITNETPNQTILSSTTASRDSARTDFTSSAHQTTSTPEHTPYKSHHSTAFTSNPNKRSTTDVQLITSHPSPEVTSFEQHITDESPSQQSLSTIKMTTTKGDSTSQQYLTPKVDKTRREHVINLGVTFTSKIQLSEDDIEELVLVEFHNLLIEMGLPTSIKVGLRRP